MQIGIEATFGFSEIFGKKLEFATQCQLQLVNGYTLVYAEIQNLDILQALNKAFKLGLLDEESLIVESAGFYTYIASKTAPSIPLSSSFPNSPIPKEVASTSTPVIDTTSFWLTVNLQSDVGDKGLFGSIRQINAVQDKKLSLSATFTKGKQASDQVKTAKYLISLQGTIKLFEFLEFSNVSISFCISDSTEIRVEGDIGIELFGSAFAFSGIVYSDSASQAVTANIAANGRAELPSLFGGAFPNISFSDIGFNLFYTYGEASTSSKFMVRGGCKFGGLDFVGLLYMERTTPILASVVFTSPASISTLFNQCLPKNVSWPSNLIELTLAQDSQAYYYKGDKPITLTLNHDKDGRPTLLPVPVGPSQSDRSLLQTAPSPSTVTFLPGFNLSASFKLELLDAVEIDGTVVVNPNGVKASIEVARAIDIYVLKITRKNQPNAGPVLSISTSEHTGTMSLEAALTFFQQDFGVNTTVTLGKESDGSLIARATLQPTKDFPPLLKTSDALGFSYSKKQGFKITDWPQFDVFDDLIDFLKHLKKLANSGSGCGEIVNFVCEESLKQRYSISPSFNSSDAGLVLTLSVTCTLSFGSTKITDMILENAVEIAIPASMSMDELLPAILKAIRDAPETFVKALLNDGTAVAQFLVLFAGKQAAQYAATLICRGLANSLVQSAAQAGMTAAGAAIGTALVAIGAVFSAIFSSNGGSGGGGGGSGGDTHTPNEPDVIAKINGSQITANWLPCSGAQTYVASVAGPEGQIETSGRLDYNVNQYTFAAIKRPAMLPATGTISVLASNSAGSSKPAELPLQFLAAPTDLSIQQASTSPPAVAVNANWIGASGDTAYTLTRTGPTETSKELHSQTLSVLLTFDASDPSGEYTLSVIATGDSSAMPSASSLPLAVKRLPAPNNLAATATVDEINVTWTVVADAASYLLAWTDPKGVYGSQSVSAVTGKGSIPLPVLDADGDWTVNVQAMPTADSGLYVGGPPSAAVTVSVSVPKSPEQVAAICFERHMTGYECGKRLVANFPLLVPNLLAAAMASGGYAAADTSDGLLAAFPDITPSAMAISLAYAYPSTPQVLARTRFTAGVSGAECGHQLITTFPDLKPNLLAVAMAEGGYEAESTGDGLHSAFSEITPAVLATALVYAYPSSAQELARTRFTAGVNGAACGQQLITTFPELTPDLLAVAMAEGGYEAEDTGDGLRSAFSEITPAMLATALVYAYPTTAQDLARTRFAAGVTSTQCGQELIVSFPDLTPNLLAVAMAEGGYDAAGAGDGLHAAFPVITAAALATALAYAYPATPEDLARTRHLAGVDASACGLQLITAFKDLTPDSFAVAMARGGYTAAETGDGLHVAFSALTPAQMAVALARAFP